MIAIVGGGYAGAATAWALARRGHGARVTLIEAEPDPGRHASGRNAGLIGSLIGEDEAVTAMTVRGARLIASEAGAGEAFTPCGSVRLVADDGAADRLAAAARARGVPVEITSTARIAEAIPALRGAVAPVAVRCPAEGTVDPLRLLRGYLDRAAEGGVRVLTGVRATSLTFSCGKLAGIETSAGGLKADWVVNAAGAWAGQVASALSGGALRDPGLSPMRRHLFVSEPGGWIDPSWPYVWDLAHGVYFRAEGRRLILCPCDEDPHPPGSPAVSAVAEAALAGKLRVAFPALSGLRVESARACLRTFAPDRRYVIGHDPRLTGFFWAAGLGGSGATASAAIGELAADLILGAPLSAESAAAARAFDPARFARAADEG